MQITSDEKFKKKYFFIIALLAHLLFLLGGSFIFQTSQDDNSIYQPYYENLPQKDTTVMQAYIPPPEAKVAPETVNQPVVKKIIPVSKEGILKSVPKTTTPAKPVESNSAPLRYMAGDVTPSSAKKTVEDELMRLLFEATNRTMVYPRMGQGFHVTGTVEIRFLISPDGQVSHVTLHKSSQFGPFDEAAFNAISRLSPVQNVDLYLKQPRYITAIIVFK
jgi:TonB family protein